MGRALGNNLINMTAYKEVKEALEEMNIDLNVIEDEEPDAKEVRFGGNIRFEKDPVTGKDKFIQENYESVMAVPYDMPVVGYGNHVVNTLRVWDAKPITDFKLDEFDRGNYHKAVEQENLAKLIVDVLYPNDNHYSFLQVFRH